MTTEFAGNYQGPLYAPHPDIKRNKMNSKQLQELKANYASLIVDGMDMNTLETFAMEMVEQNIKDWDEDDVKSEILDYYGEETLMDLMPEKPQKLTTISELEATAPDYGVGK